MIRLPPLTNRRGKGSGAQGIGSANSELEDSCQDYENTINQFRDLVLQLQT